MSPTARGAKYRNRDGSKFITLPDTMSAPDSAQPSPTTSAASGAKPQATGASGTTSNGPAPAPANVNRKKQKRREKAAAKAAAEAALNAESANGASDSAGHRPNHDPDQEDSEDDEDQFNSQLHQAHAQVNGRIPGSAPKSKKSKKKRHKGAAAAGELADQPDSPTPQLTTPHPSGISKERIWNTSSQEERERIKEFWLGLGEDERKSLVKVEKEAVLKKMKEQQKHTCSCTVCGRKRHAIEEELEGLYDAYYEELKQFANHPQQDGHPPLMGASRHFGFHHGNRFPNYAGHQPSRGRIVEHVGEDDEDDLDEDPYSDEELEDDEAYSDEEEPEEEIHRDYASEFFNFGSSLTVQGGILTVADDLLKNDGKKFIEMMEQLAERRMAREGDFAQDQYSRSYGHGVNGGLPGHDHPPPPPVDDEEYEDDEDEDYDSQEDDEYEEEDDDTMTEEQRMEEGRRMFQIFAARMFEQRVLQAYREKVARERQAKLMEEEEEELRREAARKEKKAKEAQKKKEKAAQKKQAQAEEKARREAEKAAEEEERRREEARKAEDARRKAEEKRKKKEAQRKAEEDERARKEAERQRQKQLQADQERKAKEAKDREKKAREEARLKEKEERERSDREAKELKEMQESQRRQKELESKSSENGNKSTQKQKQEEPSNKPSIACPTSAAAHNSFCFAETFRRHASLTEGTDADAAAAGLAAGHELFGPRDDITVRVYEPRPVSERQHTSPDQPAAVWATECQRQHGKSAFGECVPGDVSGAVERCENHLGSSALLDDSEDVLPTLPDFQPGLRRGYVAPGRPGPAFPPAPFADPAIASMWGSPMQPPGMSPFAQTPVAPPGFGGPVGWPASPSLGFSAPIGIGRVAPARPPASVAIRQILCNVCRDLAMKEPAKDGFIPLSSLQEAMKTYVDFNPMGDGPLTENDIVALCETEGNMANGGGNFDLVDEAGTKSIRWNPDKMAQPLGGFGAPGQIGSPVLGSSFGH
ncbi:Stress response protein nst1 [Diaporthe eres]|uniref:Stress response protein NST1 n=1 Tax=Diaporthe eres TaxID=83184 RepID=A0ABR1PR06_DIAER